MQERGELQRASHRLLSQKSISRSSNKSRGKPVARVFRVGAAVLRHAVDAFARHPRIDGIQVVIRPEDRNVYDQALAGLDLPPPVPGGAERQDSVRLGLEALPM